MELRYRKSVSQLFELTSALSAFNMIEGKTFTEIHYGASDIQKTQGIWHCLKVFARKALTT